MYKTLAFLVCFLGVLTETAQAQLMSDDSMRPEIFSDGGMILIKSAKEPEKHNGKQYAKDLSDALFDKSKTVTEMKFTAKKLAVRTYRGDVVKLIIPDEGYEHAQWAVDNNTNLIKILYHKKHGKNFIIVFQASENQGSGIIYFYNILDTAVKDIKILDITNS